MTDTVSPATRSRNMASIKSKNTKPEILIRKALHAKGFRYRLHVKNLTGKPDLVFPKYSAVIFVHGCFWHGHDCHLFRLPKSNVDYWEVKISKNIERDDLAIKRLMSAGWRVGVVWECALRGRSKVNLVELIGLIETWLHSADIQLTLQG